MGFSGTEKSLRIDVPEESSGLKVVKHIDEVAMQGWQRVYASMLMNSVFADPSDFQIRY